MLQQVGTILTKKNEFNEEIQSIDWIFKFLQQGEISENLNWKSLLNIDDDGNLVELVTNLMEQYFVTLKMAALTGLITMSALRSHFQELIKPNIMALMIIAREQLKVFNFKLPGGSEKSGSNLLPKSGTIISQTVSLQFVKENFKRVMLFLRMGSPGLYHKIISFSIHLEEKKEDIIDHFQSYFNFTQSPKQLPIFNVNFFIYFMTILFINLTILKIASYSPSVRDTLSNYLQGAQELSSEIVKNILEKDIGRDLSTTHSKL